MVKTAPFFAIALLFAVAGCSSVSMTASWTPPGYQAKNYRHIVVAGAHDSAAALCNRLTGLFAASLNRNGYEAQPSDTIITLAAIEGNGNRQTFAAMRNSGVDAVLSIAWVNKETGYYYVPATLKHASPGNSQHDFAYPFPLISNTYSFKQRYTERIRDVWVTGLYHVALEKAIYRVQVKTDRLNGASGIAEKYVRLVLDDMAGKGIVCKACCLQLAQAGNRKKPL